ERGPRPAQLAPLVAVSVQPARRTEHAGLLVERPDHSCHGELQVGVLLQRRRLALRLAHLDHGQHRSVAERRAALEDGRGRSRAPPGVRLRMPRHSRAEKTDSISYCRSSESLRKSYALLGVIISTRPLVQARLKMRWSTPSGSRLARLTSMMAKARNSPAS